MEQTSTCNVCKVVRELVEVLGTARDSLLPVIKAVQARYGVISKEAIKAISTEFNLPTSKVFGVATFYGMLTTEQQSKYVIRVCENLSCHISGAPEVHKALESELNLKMGESNELFTLIPVECLGLCDIAPAMLVNETPYGNLTPEKVREIVKKYKEGK